MITLTAKFDLGDSVWWVVHTSHSKQDPCPVCHGAKAMTVEAYTFPCPKCYGAGTFTVYLGYQWAVCDHAYTAAKVIIEHRQDHRRADETDKCVDCTKTTVQYMTHQTGCPSGTILNEADLFATRKEAVAECERRNKELK